MSKRIIFIVLFLVIFALEGFVQSNFNYEVSLIPVSVSNLSGLQSYAFAQHQEKWLILGGRKDGLHARQPFNAFPESHNNTEIFVVDVVNNQLWSTSVNELPVSIKEQLQSTNMNFYQDADSLYIIGGYGFSATSDNHITHPFLTSINVPELITAIQNNQAITPCFKQIQHDIFAVTGGHLKKLNGLFYLIGGHRFDGRYNPMGNPTYIQEYTNQIRIFSINNSAQQLSYGNYSSITDPVHLRRRDYNLLPQIFPDHEQGFTISSGVFQLNADLPFLYPVDIKQNGYTPITSFNQYLSNYHCALACLYDSAGNNMHTLFFGGMSQYYYQDGNLIQDDLVPFVKTVSRLTRDSGGNLTEYQLPLEMPALVGSGAEFIPNLHLPHFSNKVIKLNEVEQSHFMIGHIFGGIRSPLLNPFSNNQTNQTSADNTIYEVWLTENPLSTNEHKIDGKNPYKITIHPNPFKNDFRINFHSDKEVHVNYLITNNSGHILLQSEDILCASGNNTIDVNWNNKKNVGQLFLTVIIDNKFYMSKKLIRK